MLARLLRWIILVLCGVGAAIGYAIACYAQAPLWVVIAGAAVWPFVTLLFIELVSAFKSKGNEPMGLWWRALWGEYVAGIQVFLLRQPWSLAQPGPLPALASQPRVPVVLVHGYMCNHRTWDDMADALRANGHTVMAINLEPLFTSIDHYAPLVHAAVTTLCKKTGASQVALVGHSMGGLAIRAWMRAHGTHHVARVITLGTPHAGTQIDPHARTPNGKQMVWRSPWLAELAGSESEATRALMRIALTPQDNIVYPQRAQVLPGVPTTVFEGMGHVQLCLEPAVIDWVCQQLTIFTLHPGEAI